MYGGWKDNLVFNSDGLIPAIAQDFKTKDVLMLAYMNKESLEKTIETNKAHYYSRSRKKLWLKGETSGHYQVVKNILYDCDEDSLLLMVEQAGDACHTGNRSCFYRGYNDLAVSSSNNANIIFDIYNVIADRKSNPVEGSYTNYLLDSGIDKILKKVGEESAEVIIASKNSDKHEVSYEVSDLIYHLSVLLFERNITWNEIFDELAKRR